MTDLPSLFYAPMRAIVARPLLALAPALVFGAAFYELRGRDGAGLLLLAALFWAVYAAYETYAFHWAKTVTAPIRIDLLFLTPILYAMLAAGLLGWWRALRSRP
jgi:hypothetical protein